MPSSASAVAIEFRQVSKSYPVYQSPRLRLQELLTLNHVSFHDDFWALRDVDVTIRRGETFCVIGENGSGKSTMLQIVAGILRPTAGEARINGRVAALLELGAGFNPEFSGRDNVYLNGSILGLSSREIDQRYESIAAFAEIGDFIHQPVKTYSSGMVVRLAFAVAIHVDPEILLVDEALAVGDFYFRQRCLRKVHELRSRGVTILFVSHALGDVKAIGDRCLWLEKGRVRALGPTDEVVDRFVEAMTAKDSAYVAEHPAKPAEAPEASPVFLNRVGNVDHRSGNGRAEITGIGVFDEFGREQLLLNPGARVTVRISAQARAAIEAPCIGFLVRNQLGIDFCASDTSREGRALKPLRPGEKITVDFHLELPELYPAEFSFSPSFSDGTPGSDTICDWIDNAITLQMSRADEQIYGYVHLPCKVEVNAKLAGRA